MRYLPDARAQCILRLLKEYRALYARHVSAMLRAELPGGGAGADESCLFRLLQNNLVHADIPTERIMRGPGWLTDDTLLSVSEEKPDVQLLTAFDVLVDNLPDVVAHHRLGAPYSLQFAKQQRDEAIIRYQVAVPQPEQLGRLAALIQGGQTPNVLPILVLPDLECADMFAFGHPHIIAIRQNGTFYYYAKE